VADDPVAQGDLRLGVIEVAGRRRRDARSGDARVDLVTDHAPRRRAERAHRQ
jgi:hypothetical protein